MIFFHARGHLDIWTTQHLHYTHNYTYQLVVDSTCIWSCSQHCWLFTCRLNLLTPCLCSDPNVFFSASISAIPANLRTCYQYYILFSWFERPLECCLLVYSIPYDSSCCFEAPHPPEKNTSPLRPSSSSSSSSSSSPSSSSHLPNGKYT